MIRRAAIPCLLALLVAATALAQAPSPMPPLAVLPGRVFHSAQIPYKGIETHPPHSHAHEEIIVVVEGTIEVSIDGKSETVEAGSVIHYEPNKPHNLRNVGKTPARYYVIELRGRND